MFRFAVTFIALCASLVAAFALRPPGAPPAAQACSIAPSYFEDLAHDAQFIVLAQAVSVGGPENLAPTLTPTSTGTATATDTRVPSATRTPTATRTARTSATATPTPTLTATWTPQPREDLTGAGAMLSIARTYAGSPPASPFAIDEAARAYRESELRMIEAGHVPICESGVVRYVAGGSYAVFAGSGPAGDIATSLKLRVQGEDVILCDGSPDQRCLFMRGATYRRFFAGLDARFDKDPQGGDDHVLLMAARMPLARFVAAVEGVRNPVRFTPPETGSAGLAARR